MSPTRHGASAARSHAFTLIELVLVMVILAAVLGVAAPSLSRFFGGRNLDSEAHRLLALTRYATERANAEGIPMDLWIDIQKRRYGLRADTTWNRDDAYAAEFEVAEDVDIQVRYADLNSRTNGSLDIQQPANSTTPTIRFQPDGTFGPSSPEWIQLEGRRETEGNRERLWIAPGQTRPDYELWTIQPPTLR